MRAFEATTGARAAIVPHGLRSRHGGRSGGQWIAVPAIVIGTAISGWTSATADVLRCAITEKHYCELDAGCAQIAASAWNVLNRASGTFARCEQGRCNSYPARFTSSGMFTVVDVPGQGVLAKLSADGRTFTEVVMLGTTVYLSFGSCREVKED